MKTTLIIVIALVLLRLAYMAGYSAAREEYEPWIWVESKTELRLIQGQEEKYVITAPCRLTYKTYTTVKNTNPL